MTSHRCKKKKEKKSASVLFDAMSTCNLNIKLHTIYITAILIYLTETEQEVESVVKANIHEDHTQIKI